VTPFRDHLVHIISRFGDISNDLVGPCHSPHFDLNCKFTGALYLAQSIEELLKIEYRFEAERGRRQI